MNTGTEQDVCPALAPHPISPSVSDTPPSRSPHVTHLQNRLQMAGYEAKVEKWDGLRQSDSNDSDEENLKQ